MTVDYEVRRPLIGNLDVVGKFHAEEQLRARRRRWTEAGLADIGHTLRAIRACWRRP